MQNRMKRAGAVAALATAATVGFGAMSTQAQAGCVDALVGGETATVRDWGPEPVVSPPFVGVDLGEPNRLVGDTQFNANYFVNCVA